MINEPGYFFNPIKRDISITQGDTCSFGFQIQGLEGEKPSAIYFSCKEKIEDDEALFRVTLSDNIDERSYDSEKDILTYGVRIPPQYTHNLPLGRYFYDLQVQVNGDIITLMVGRLTLEYQVTREYGPTPPPIVYEDGDDDKYPIADIPLSLKKIYTTSYISNIASKINNINEDTSSTYTTEEMVEALDTIESKLLTIGGKISDITEETDITSLDDMAPAIDNFSLAFTRIDEAINSKLDEPIEMNYSQLYRAIVMFLDKKYESGEEVSY